jgi:2-oxoisovalerate dehydrogenase E1 component
MKVYMPSNANDAAHLLYSAAQGEDPVLMLLPKARFQNSVRRDAGLRLYPERARMRRQGQHVSVVAWGNCVELAEEAAAILEKSGVSAEVVDLPSLVPCDWLALHTSVQKTGRLVVVQEDARSCSFGQSVITQICGNKQTWERLYAAPQLVSRDDVHVGFSRVLERAVLPDVPKILRAVKTTLGQADA